MSAEGAAVDMTRLYVDSLAKRERLRNFIRRMCVDHGHGQPWVSDAYKLLDETGFKAAAQQSKDDQTHE